MGLWQTQRRDDSGWDQGGGRAGGLRKSVSG